MILLITVSYDFDNSSSLDSLEKFSTAFISSQFWFSTCKFVFSIVYRGYRSWKVGTLERWNAGTLERWNPELLILTTRPGMLERWNAGTLEYWQWGQERWNARMLEPLLVRGSNNFCYLNFNTILLIFINKDFIKKVNDSLFWLFFIFNEVLHLTALT